MLIGRLPLFLTVIDPGSASEFNTPGTSMVGRRPRQRLPPRDGRRTPRDSVVDVSALVTLDKQDLGEPTGTVPPTLMDDVERGLRRVLEL